MRRVAIVGPPGSGKSTLAGTIAARYGLRHVELDAINHQPDWTPLPVPEFRQRVTKAIVNDGWVVDGNYRPVQDLVQGAADTIIFLDLSRWLVTARVAWRSLRRVITREELWNGNRESMRNLVSRDPERNIIVWAWQHQPKYRELYGGFIRDGYWDHADVHHLRTPSDVRSFVVALPDARD
ncbi:MAG: AAA family ATPase [Actinomycetota bacterium]